MFCYTLRTRLSFLPPQQTSPVRYPTILYLIISFSSVSIFVRTFHCTCRSHCSRKKKVHKGAGLYESIFFPGLTTVKIYSYIPTLNLFMLSKLRSSPSLPCSNTEGDFPVDNFWFIFKVPRTRHLTLLRFSYCNRS